MRLLPAKVDRVTGDVKAIAAPKLGNYSLALMADGTVMSWGATTRASSAAAT